MTSNEVDAYLEAKGKDEIVSAFEAISARGAAAVPELLARLREALIREPINADNAGRIQAALLHLGSPALPPLMTILRDRMEPVALRARAARVTSQILGRRNLLSLVEILATELEEQPSPLGARLIEILGDMGDSRPLPILLRALRHDDPSVRFAAATALGKIGDAASVSPLLEAFNDPEWVVQVAVNRALVRLSGVDQGYDPEAPETERKAAAGRWLDWWKEHRAEARPVLPPDEWFLWLRVNEALAWAILGYPVTGTSPEHPFPGDIPPPDEPIYVLSDTLPEEFKPQVEGRQVNPVTEETLADVKAGYWKIGAPDIEGNKATIPITRVISDETASMRLALQKDESGTWRIASVTLIE